MTKIDYLKQAKRFIVKVINYREFLVKTNKSYLPTGYSTGEITKIRYHLQSISSSYKMQQYIQRNETTLRMLIPSNKTKWENELRELLQYNPAELVLEF